MKSTAEQLREEDAKRWTQKRVAEALGVSHQTVSLWFGSNSSAGITSKPKPDARVKVPPERKPEIAERIEAGEDREQVANLIKPRRRRQLSDEERNRLVLAGAANGVRTHAEGSP